ncbi:MAG: cell wall-active antibiotics response protein [Treponema sp.]|jgi:hypothetical protein|nr:cell wall-active antibiotics response protein [Treponema sp.]
MTNKNVALSPRETQIEERKNQAIEALSVQFSLNALSIEEYERLVEYINRVESERELVIVDKIVNETALYAGNPAPMPASVSTAPALSNDGESKLDLALFSNRKIFGDTLLTRRRSFIALFGNTIITIRDGDLPGGRTVLRVNAVLGNVIIKVPPSLVVSMEAVAYLGNTVLRSQGQRLPGCPELVITGGAYLGNIMVKVLKEKKRLY